MIPEWATHIAVDADGEVWAFEGEPVWVQAAGPSSVGHWAPVDDYDGLRFELIGAERVTNKLALITDAARLLCVPVPRPEGWSPPEREENSIEA